MHLSVFDGLPADHGEAVQVWRAANVARLRPPGPDRVARIWEKLAYPDACLVLGRADAGGDVLATALAEPGRAQDGEGTVIAGYAHVSMVFVHPDFWGRGVGRQLLQGFHQRALEKGWRRMSLWTRTSNVRARCLYEGQGYRTTGRETTIEDGDPVLELERRGG